VVAAFWAALVFLIVLFATIKLLKIPVGFKYDPFLLPLVLFIPLGLVMACVHEFGHALWGTLLGGMVTSIQVAYLELYPVIRLTPHFVVGFVGIEGISGFEYGLFLVGGSITTNIVAWLLALILHQTHFGTNTQRLLQILGLFGLLDLPFYVVFPQIGLRHWIVIGGNQPEPLLGARLMGIPDSIFYIVGGLTTLGLSVLYLKPFLKKFQGLLLSIRSGAIE
jgi:hypothetical protein